MSTRMDLIDRKILDALIDENYPVLVDWKIEREREANRLRPPMNPNIAAVAEVIIRSVAAHKEKTS